jgi:rhs protein
MTEQQLLPSTGKIHARFGDGQYFTDINPIDFTAGQVSRRLYGVPWKTNSLTHYIQIDVTGLNVIKNAPFNYYIPNNQPLIINNRIVSSGISIFKIKF